jgi:hypothetical protein
MLREAFAECFNLVEGPKTPCAAPIAVPQPRLRTSESKDTSNLLI